jgi:HAMP domain-containing protein
LKRLIIKHGDRVIRHELSDQPVTIGRDPGCDLFFTDTRLSRRHAMIEPSEGGVRFIDLGSRNGSFIEGQRIEEQDLEPGVEVRLGGLLLTYEDDTPPPPETEDADDTATVVLTSPPVPTPSPDDSATVMLSAGPDIPEPEAKPAEPEQQDATVMLPPRAGKPEGAGGTPEDDKTVLLNRRAEEKADDDTGTLLLKPEAPAAGRVHSDTRILTPQDLAPAPSEPVPAEPPLMPSDEAEVGAAGWMSSLSWSAKFLLLSAGLALLVYFMLAMPLVRTLGNALREESLRRGRVILELLTEANGPFVGEGRLRELNVDGVLREERVKEALLLDLEGNVLAPSNRTDEVMSSIEGIGAPIEDIRTFYLGRRGSDYVLVQPLLYQSRRVGIAVVVYEVATASASWATAVLFLAFLVLLLGVVTTLLLGRRMTLDPLSSLRDDVEAIVKGDADYVPPRQAFPELSDVAKSINRLVERSFARTVRGDAAPKPTEPSPPKPRRQERSARPIADRPSPAVVESRVEAEATPTPREEPQAATEGARFWVDENFVVIRAEEEAAGLVGTTASAMEGKHLIEAVADQKLLEVVLDAINGLGEGGSSTAETENIKATAARQQGAIVVGLRQL